VLDDDVLQGCFDSIRSERLFHSMNRTALQPSPHRDACVWPRTAVYALRAGSRRELPPPEAGAHGTASILAVHAHAHEFSAE